MKPASNSSRTVNLNNPFEIPAAPWPNTTEIAEVVSSILANKTPVRTEHATGATEAPPSLYLKALISIATNAWRARTKMMDAETGEMREDMKRVGRHVDAIYRNLAEVGIVIRDHTGDAYDEGQPMKVIASKPKPGLNKERVSETLLPSIFWNDRLVQNGEIVTETPVAPNTSTESQSHSK